MSGAICLAAVARESVNRAQGELTKLGTEVRSVYSTTEMAEEDFLEKI
jgi:hypothetical protein